MWVYFCLLVLPLVLAAADRLPPRLAHLPFLFVWLALTLFLGLRREIAGDWDNYLVMFARAHSYDLPEALTINDPGYMLLSAAVGRLGFSVAIVNLICAAIFSAGLLVFVRRQKLAPLALLIAIPVLIAIGGVGTTRQAVAAGLLMAALVLYGEGARRRPALLLLGALTFHWTAIVVLPLALWMVLRRIPNGLVIAAGAAAGAAFVAAFLLLPGLAGRFAHVGQSSGALMRGSLTLMALVVLFVGWRRLELNEDERRCAAYLAALGIFSLMVTTVFATAGDRIGFYAIPLQMMVLPRAAALVRPGLYRAAAQAVIAAPFVALLTAYLTLTSYRPCLLPYRNYLGNPGALRITEPEPPRLSGECQAVLDRP